MPFPTFKDSHREPILCWLYGIATGGKSTLALDFFRENQPGVIIPMDQRYEDFKKLALEEGVTCWPVSDPNEPTVWANADKILAALRANFPGSGAKSIVWDSISPEFRTHVEWAQTYADMSGDERAKALGPKFRNKSALYQPKAHYMELVAQIANLGVACMWISHEHEGRDGQGQETDKYSITKQERLKFRKNVNLWLSVIVEGGKYGVKVEEARNRPSMTGKVFWDTPNNKFKGMWKQISEEFYNSPVVDMSWASFGINKPFPSPEKAIEMGVEFSVESGGETFYAFGDPGEAGSLVHAQNAYKKLREGGYEDFRKPTKPGEMAESWKLLVERKAWVVVQEAAKKPEPEPEPTDQIGFEVEEPDVDDDPNHHMVPDDEVVQEQMF